MTVRELGEKLDLKLIAGESGLDNKAEGMYIGDLLSWVMGKCKENNIWVTIQGHVNIIAVASLTAAACIIVAEGAEIDEATVKKAESEEIPVFSTKLNSFEIAELYLQ